MGVGRRIGAIAIIVVGAALVAFYWLLFAIADCSADCVARGERAIPLALVAVGVGMVVGGVLGFRTGTRRALGIALVVAGALGALAIGWIMLSEGSRGAALWLAPACGVLGLAGGFMLWSRR